MLAWPLPGTSGLAAFEERDGKLYATQSSETTQRATI
jgi:hypothetical protein